MMFHLLSGLGDDNSASAAALAIGNNPVTNAPSPLATPDGDYLCNYCRGLSTFQLLAAPSCWGMSDSNPHCQATSITQAAIVGATAAPPSQAAIDSQSPETTIDQILTATQANSVAAAVAAANAYPNDPGAGGSNPPSGPCATSPNSILCWLSQNSGMVFTIGLCIAGFAYIAPSKGGR